MFEYPLFDALLNRRSRRFARGLKLDGGPLAYESTQPLRPLSRQEEAALAFAACGTTGPVMAELPYHQGGQIMAQFIGRTAASGDALHTVVVFVINDDGVFLLKRPQDFAREELPGLVEAAHQRKLVDLYERSRVRISSQRLDIPRDQPFLPSFNRWVANLPGTTYFLPVNEYTSLYINMLLSAFGEDFGYFLVDDRNGFKPAGVGQFARSKGGHLLDDPKAGRMASVSFIESWLYELVAVEQGAILQNLGLMAQALGVGGFPHFAAHPFIWFQTLGFRMESLPFSRLIGAGAIARSAMRLLGKDIPVPSAVGLEYDGKTLIRPYCPPYYPTMRHAVMAFLETKYKKDSGTFRDGGAGTAWREGGKVQSGIPQYSERTIEATIAYCEYVYRRYGRFPANCGPFRTILAYQAHHLDAGFYDRFYKPEAAAACRPTNTSF